MSTNWLGGCAASKVPLELEANKVRDLKLRSKSHTPAVILITEFSHWNWGYWTGNMTKTNLGNKKSFEISHVPLQRHQAVTNYQYSVVKSHASQSSHGPLSVSQMHIAQMARLFWKNWNRVKTRLTYFWDRVNKILSLLTKSLTLLANLTQLLQKLVTWVNVNIQLLYVKYDDKKWRATYSTYATDMLQKILLDENGRTAKLVRATATIKRKTSSSSNEGSPCNSTVWGANVCFKDL